MDNVCSFEINNIELGKASFNEIIPGPIAPAIDWTITSIEK